MNPVEQNHSVYTEEATARKVKSISPHFKPSSCRMTGPIAPQPLKKLVSLKLKATGSNPHHCSSTMPQLAPAMSLGSKPTQQSEDVSNASSIVAYSNKYDALSKVKPLATLVGRLPESSAIKISSRTSLSNSFDGIPENMPETLILGPRIVSLGQPGSEIDKPVKVGAQTSTAITLGSGIKGPVKVFHVKNLMKACNQDQSPVNSCHKNSDLDRVQEEKPLEDPTHRRAKTGNLGPWKESQVLKIKNWDNDEVPSSNHQSKNGSPGGFSRYAARGGSSPEPVSPNMLMSPKSRQQKANLNNSGHLLELVDPNDGFDLDILSSAEQQGEDSEPEDKEEVEKKKKMTKIFNFDHCTVNKGRRQIRKSVDGGKAHSEIPGVELPSPEFDRSMDQEVPPTFTRCVSGQQGSSNQKRVTSKPIPVNFEKLRLISKELQDNKNQQRVCRTVIKPSLQHLEDL